MGLFARLEKTFLAIIYLSFTISADNGSLSMSYNHIIFKSNMIPVINLAQVAIYWVCVICPFAYLSTCLSIYSYTNSL